MNHKLLYGIIGYVSMVAALVLLTHGWVGICCGCLLAALIFLANLHGKIA